MSDPYVTVAELAALGVDTSTGDPDLAVESACEAVRGYLDNHITFEQVTLRLDGTGTDALVLPRPPIRRVTSVTESDTLLTVDDDYWLGTAGILYRVGASWAEGRGNVLVDYDRGWDLLSGPYGGPYSDPTLTIPADIIDVTLNLARRLLFAPTLPVGGFSSETMGQYSYTRDSAQTVGVTGLTVDEKATLDHYLRRGVA